MVLLDELGKTKENIMKLPITKIRTFSRTEDASSFSTIRVNKSVLAKLGGRNHWVRIKHGKKAIYRMAKGADAATGFTKETVELDYDSWLELDYDPDTKADENRYFPCSMKIRKAVYFEHFIAHWTHPDPAYSVPMQFGIITYLMGIGSAVIGFLIGS